MHHAAYRWIERSIAKIPPPARVLEFGSRNINGTPRPLLPHAFYIGVDMRAGSGVDVVCDAVRYEPDHLADLVICAEVLEHAEQAGQMVAHAVACTAPGGHLIVTCATYGRVPHSGHDGGALRAGEHYANIGAEELSGWLERAGAEVVEQLVHPERGDLYVLARVPA
jgi:hypothetical protein